MSSEKAFSRLVLGAAVVTFLLITVGAITRVTESGMGCGTDWPNCNGKIIPEFQDAAVIIEYGHRLFALLVGIFAAATAIQGWRKYRHDQKVFVPIVAGVVLYFVQSGLGAITVKLGNEWVSVLLHLANSLLLLGCYLVAWVNLRETGNEERRSSLPFAGVVSATVLAFGVVLLGAMVAGNYATKACVGWPLCMGEVWPADQGPLQLLNMIHRLAAGSLGIALLLLLIRAFRLPTNRLVRGALLAAAALYLCQSALGALVVLINDSREWLTLSRSLHVTFAAGTWSAMIILSGVTWLQQHSYRKENQKQMPGVPARSATISS